MAVVNVNRKSRKNSRTVSLKKRVRKPARTQWLDANGETLFTVGMLRALQKIGICLKYRHFLRKRVGQPLYTLLPGLAGSYAHGWGLPLFGRAALRRITLRYLEYRSSTEPVLKSRATVDLLNELRSRGVAGQQRLAINAVHFNVLDLG